MTSKSADRLRVINSRTGEVVTSDVHVAGAEDVELAVGTAKRHSRIDPGLLCPEVDEASCCGSLPT